MTTPTWANRETELVWQHQGAKVAAIIGCHPENPPSMFTAEFAREYLGCDELVHPRKDRIDLTDDFVFLCVERADWQQIAGHLNSLVSPPEATGPLHDWYAVAYEDESLAFSVGEYPADARMEASNYPSTRNMNQMFIAQDTVNSGKGFIVFPITPDLARAIDDDGCESWTYINGVGCTWEEAQEAE